MPTRRPNDKTKAKATTMREGNKKDVKEIIAHDLRKHPMIVSPNSNLMPTPRPEAKAKATVIHEDNAKGVRKLWPTI